MSFTHIVTFTWASGDHDTMADSLAEARRALVVDVQGVEDHRCGRDIGLTLSGYDFAVVGAFHGHQRIINDLIAPNRTAEPSSSSRIDGSVISIPGTTT